MDRAEKRENEYRVEDPVKTIREILAEKGMSQQQLADNMGTIRQNVSQMLSRGTKSPRFDSFAKMVEALDCEVIVRKKSQKTSQNRSKILDKYANT